MLSRILAVAIKHLELRYRYIVRKEKDAKFAYNMIYAYNINSDNIKFGI